MNNLIKRVLRFYWHHSQAYALFTLPLNGIGALSSLLVLFTVVSGIKFPIWVYAVAFIVITVSLFVAGSLAKKSGLLSYWQSLNNSQNPELLKILQNVETQNDIL